MTFCEPVKLFLRLVRLPLSLFVALSAVAGQVLHHPPESWRELAPAGFGVLLLACGCSSLNQVQERRSDARMARTRQRPLASGRWSAATGLVISAFLLTAGLFLLMQIGNSPAPSFGVFAVIWYNAVYTPLKERCAFAVLPGALCGAIPPLIGWIAAGGNPLDFRAVTLAMLFFLWQMPHFWLLLSRYREDYRRAGLPNFFDRFSPRQADRLIALWMLALATALLLPPALGLVRQPGLIAPYLGGTALLATMALSGFLPRRNARRIRPLFIGINSVMLTATLALLADHLVF